jgi:hypothetical protein
MALFYALNSSAPRIEADSCILSPLAMMCGEAWERIFV